MADTKTSTTNAAPAADHGGSKAPTPETFTCAACGGTFEKGWSEDEALAELDAIFGVPVTDCLPVCDDCWRRMGLA